MKLPHLAPPPAHEFDHMPSQESFLTLSETFKLLGDTSRVRIFWILCHCEECVVNLSAMMDMSSPALSHHLRHLKDNGLIVNRREGKEVYYKAAQTPLATALHKVIETMAQLPVSE